MLQHISKSQTHAFDKIYSSWHKPNLDRIEQIVYSSMHIHKF